MAWNFLSVLPPRLKSEANLTELAKSMAFFPLAGICLAILPAIFIFLSYSFMPSFLGALITVGIFTVLTGGLHIDGLADTVDGFMGGRDRKEILDIMRDSRIGTMGVLAIVFIFAFKIALLNVIWMKGNKSELIKAVLVFPLLSRWAMVNAALSLPYARSDKGIGETFAKKLTLRDWALATLFSIIIAGIIYRLYALILVLFVYLTGLLLVKYYEKRIGGITGDMFGAVNEIVEAVSLGYILLII